jgi:polyhydroxyalkanoate synthesis repressor PhaR
VPPRLITRYGNRKLYDATGRRYVSIEDLAGLIAGGEDVHVRDRGTGEDITTVVLAQVIVDRLKEQKGSIPRQVLTRLIRLAEGPVSAWADWDGPQEAAARARSEAERIASDQAASVQHLVKDAQGTVESRLRQWLPATKPTPPPRKRARAAIKTRRRKR